MSTLREGWFVHIFWGRSRFIGINIYCVDVPEPECRDREKGILVDQRVLVQAHCYFNSPPLLPRLFSLATLQ